MFGFGNSTQFFFELFILLVKWGSSGATCTSNAMFNLVGQGNRLHGHVIKEHYAKNVIDCTYYCYNELPACKSFNLERGVELSSDVQRKCQLNNSTKSLSPLAFIAAETFDYWENTPNSNPALQDNTSTLSATLKTSSATPTTLSATPTSSKPILATSCAALYKSGERTDGLYSINPDGKSPFMARCDMTSNGGGWTVLQRRLNGSSDFNVYWMNYKTGFGEFDAEFWLGLHKMYLLTSIEPNTLRIDLKSFAGEYRYATYATFAVADETNGYMLTAENYAGNAGDSLKLHNGMLFTTRDVDNDASGWQNCATAFKGGWWFHACHSSNLNGFYHRGHYSPEQGDRDGVVWEAWKGTQESLKETVMKIRPNDF